MKGMGLLRGVFDVEGKVHLRTDFEVRDAKIDS